MNPYSFGPQLRDLLAKQGVGSGRETLRAALVEHAPLFGRQSAETLWLSLAGSPEMPQADVDAIGDSVLEATGAMLTSCFAEFGWKDHPDCAEALQRAEVAFLERIATLVGTVEEGGRA